MSQTNQYQIDWDLPTRAPSLDSQNSIHSSSSDRDRTAYNSRAPSFKSEDHKLSDEASKPQTVQEEVELESDNKVGEDLADQSNYLPHKQVIVVYLSLCIGLFSSFLDQTIVAAAVPAIASSLGGAKESSWLSTGYLVASTAFQPIWGRVSDIVGRKRCFLLALFLFSLGNLLAVTGARTMLQLIVFRSIAGLGGGAVQSMVLIIISDIVPLKSRGNYQGLIGLFNASGNAIGPLVGGSLVKSPSLGWKAVFLVSLPLNAVCAIFTIIFIPLKPVLGSTKDKVKKIDFVGTFLISTGTILLLLALNWGGLTYSWSSYQILLPLSLSVVLIAAFVFWEWKGAKFPIIPLAMFKNRTVSVVIVSQFSSGVGMYVLLFMIPQLLQVVKGYSGVKAGVALIPLTVLQSVGSAGTGFLVTKLQRYKAIVLIGFAIYSLGIGLLISVNQSTSLEVIIVYCIIAGIGSGGCTQTQLLAAQCAVSRKEQSLVTSARNFFRLLGGTLGLAFSYLILNIAVTSVKGDGITEELILSDPTLLYEELDLDSEVRRAYINAYVKGFQNVFTFVTACLLLALMISTLWMKEYSLARKDDEEMLKKGAEFVKKRKGGEKDLEVGSGELSSRS